MSISTTEWLLNFGVAGLVIVLILTGVIVPGFLYKELQRTNEKLADALELERQRNTDLQQLAATGVRALDALREVAQERRGEREREVTRSVARSPSGTAESGG